jgi:hypothetical protein
MDTSFENWSLKKMKNAMQGFSEEKGGMTEEKPYSIITEIDKLCFRTSSFEADKESVLHKGIYNYELSSMLSAMILSGIVYTIMAFSFKVTIIHYLASTLIFIVAFICCRRYIFRDRDLEIVFDKTKKSARLCWPGFIGMRTEEIPFGSIKSVEAGSRQIIPVNIDGIEFVQKISAQHGSPVPGLGEEKEFVTLLLKLTDGTERIIYAGRIENINEPSLPLNEIRGFLGK